MIIVTHKSISNLSTIILTVKHIWWTKPWNIRVPILIQQKKKKKKNKKKVAIVPRILHACLLVVEVLYLGMEVHIINTHRLYTPPKM
jgi:hypothetical protein